MISHFIATCGCIASVRGFVFRRLLMTFICVWTIQMGKISQIKDNKSNQWSLVSYMTEVIGILITITIEQMYKLNYQMCRL